MSNETDSRAWQSFYLYFPGHWQANPRYMSLSKESSKSPSLLKAKTSCPLKFNPFGCFLELSFPADVIQGISQVSTKVPSVHVQIPSNFQSDPPTQIQLLSSHCSQVGSASPKKWIISRFISSTSASLSILANCSPPSLHIWLASCHSIFSADRIYFPW